MELAGTGKTPPDLIKSQRKAPNAGRPKHPTPNANGISVSDKNNNNVPAVKSIPSPTVEEPEESVRDLVSRLENNTISVRSKPRIIESKCIEKTDESKAEPAITINSLSTEVTTAALKNALVEQPPTQPDTPSAVVTVNNHSVVPGQLMIPPLLKGQKSTEHQSTADRPPKVCRNKNVDLAFAATINKAVNKPDKEKQNLARRSSLATNSSVDTVDSLDTAPSSAASTGKTVTFNFQDQPKNGAGDDDDENNNEKAKPNNRGEVEQRENLKPSVIAEQRKSDELTSPKLVNWSSIGKGSFDERQYFANDKKLIEKRKYDEMEFEEFEVLDPNAPVVQQQQQQSTTGECYDSLNGSQ